MQTASNTGALIVDLDGTLLNSSRAVSPCNLEALRECLAAGMLLVVATARPLRSVWRLLPEELLDGYLVLCNGAWTVREDEVVWRDEIPRRVVEHVVGLLEGQGLAPGIEAENRFYTDTPLRVGLGGVDPPLGAYPGVDACKVLARLVDRAQGAAAGRLLPETCGHVITDGDSILSISARSCSKFAACARVLQWEGVALEDTYAFGDDHNDLPLLALAGHGFAMGNAPAEVKRRARYIALSNDEDGVGKALREHLLDRRG